MVAEAVDGLLLATVHVYSPPLVTVRVCEYCAVTPLFNTVLVPSVTVTEYLVQVTLVAGPPIEIHKSVFTDCIVTPLDRVILTIVLTCQYMITLAKCLLITFIRWIQSYIDCLSFDVVDINIIDSNCFNLTLIDARR